MRPKEDMYLKSKGRNGGPSARAKTAFGQHGVTKVLAEGEESV
jgi:hypothetical protein